MTRLSIKAVALGTMTDIVVTNIVALPVVIIVAVGTNIIGLPMADWGQSLLETLQSAPSLF